MSELGLAPSLAAGASSGSIVAAAIAAGRGAALSELWLTTAGRSVVSWRRALANRSPFDMSTIVRDALRASLGAGDLRAAAGEALCTVTRLSDLGAEVRSSRREPDYVQAVLGSCFFPVLYGRAIRLDGRLVVDGGFADNLPVRALVARGADVVVAVVPSHDGTALPRAFKARVRPEAMTRDATVVTIAPARPLAIRAWDLDAARMREAIAAGRAAAEQAVPRIERALASAPSRMR